MDGAERRQDSPNKNRAGPLRYITRPADPFSQDLRYKTLPARSKTPYLARSACAGRTLYRCHQQEAVRGELCTEYKSETGLAITVHQAPPVWRARRAWLRCPWAAGPGRAIYSDPAPLVWKAPEGPEGTGGLRDRSLRAKRACGDLAGGRARRRPEHPWGHKQHHQSGQATRQDTARGPKRRSASGPSHAEVSATHRLSWMLRPGTASISSRVYAWTGLLNSSSVELASTSLPFSMTITSSAIWRTTARSCVMNR